MGFQGALCARISTGNIMADVQVTCITKPHPESPHEHITHLGNPGAGWTWPREQVIESIETNTNTFFVVDPRTGKRANIGVVRAPRGMRPTCAHMPTASGPTICCRSINAQCEQEQSALAQRDHVASMSRGVAGKVWEALKTKGNFWDTTRHGIRENASQFARYLADFLRLFWLRRKGSNLRNGGIKTRSFSGRARRDSNSCSPVSKLIDEAT